MRLRYGLFVVLGGLALPATAAAGTITGTVFVDRDRNGIPSSNEAPVPGAVVAWQDQVFARSNAQGRFELKVPNRDGIVWVRVPDGFTPGPVWQRVRTGAGDVDLGVVPVDPKTAGDPLTFVVAADSHMRADPTWDIDELATSVEQAIALDPAPRFFTIVGDITQANRPSEFADVKAVVDHIDVPWVPVPGNHDWYDGGAAWRDNFGPDNYSFDIGGVHFVVWNSMMREPQVRDFFARETAFVEPGTMVVALAHAPPDDPVVAALRSAGVDLLISGHWHSNRVVDHGDGLIELNTQNFIMGGMDFSPAGYRVVTLEGGKVSSYHRTVVDEPFLRLMSPAGGTCAPPSGFDLLVAAEVDASAAEVVSSIDCGEERRLEPVGGWAYRTHYEGLSPGSHTVCLLARGHGGRQAYLELAIDVCEPPVSAARTMADWPQLQGDATHRGYQAAEIAPPLVPLWTKAVGGHVHQGAPVVAGGVVYVSVTDFGQGDGGGVVALDLVTGAERWRHSTRLAVRNAPAVAGGVVVITMVNGEVQAVDAATGMLRWSHDLADGLDEMVSTLFAPATVDDTGALVGVQRHFAAFDVGGGRVEWEVDPVPNGEWHGSLAAAASGGGMVVATFNRERGGVVAWDRTSGREVWRLGGAPAIAINGAPVIVDDVVFLANGRDEAYAVELDSGRVRWSTSLDPEAGDWAYAISATPAYADGRLFVATLYGDLVALDGTTGTELWRYAGTPSPIHTTHYRGKQQSGFQGSPLVTGSIVWIGGNDGRLSALDATTGDELWTTQIGAPILSGMAAAGDYLVVASWDGTVRAMAKPMEVREPPKPPVDCPDPAPPPPPAEDGGCCGAGRASTELSLALVVIVALARRRRPRR